jgi:chitodextrinase
MLGAAPKRWRRRASLSFAAVVLTLVPLASARVVATASAATPVLPAEVWALYVDKSTAGKLSAAALQPLRANEMNTLIVDGRGLALASVRRVERLARRAGLIVLVLNRPSARAGGKVTQPRCRRWRKSPSVRCIAVARTVPEARRLAGQRAGAIVLLKVTSQRSLAALRGLASATHLIAVLDAGAGSQLRNPASWRLAIQTASAGDRLHLAFAPPASRIGATTSSYATLVAAEVASNRTISDDPTTPAPAVPPTPDPTLVPTAPTGSPAGSGGGGGSSSGGGTVDTQAPTAPTGLAVTHYAQTSISLSWQASTDEVGVTGYRLYRGPTVVAGTAARSYSFSGLTCGTTYVLGVDAFDAASNDSARATVSAATSACQSPPPTADTQAPSVPQGMAFTGRTQASVTVGWQASSDNVGVAGYRTYRNNVLIASTMQLSYTFSGLSCGTSYTFALEGYDAAGNVSNRAAASGVTSTDACDEEPPPPPPPGGGGSASLFVAPGGSDGGSCTQAAPCASFQRAYEVAAPGAVVEVAGGTYPSQTFRAVSGKSAPNVVFRPASGARVILGGLGFGANGDPALGPDFITVRGMEMTYKGSSPGAGNQQGVHAGPGSTYITLEDIDAGSVSSWFADHLTIRGGDYGPCDAIASGNANVCGNNKQDISTNVLIEGAYFHDLEYDPSAPDAHWECMYINAGRNVTIRGNRFERCAIFDLFVTLSGPDARAMGHENLTIENNWFAPATNGFGSPSRGWSSLAVSWCQNAPQPSYRNVKIRNNSFGPGAGIEKDLNADAAGCQWQNVSVTGNIGTYGGCQNGWTYAGNLFVGSQKCSASDGNLVTLPYVNPSGLDYHLAAGSVAEGFVPGSFCSATDFDGQSRATPCDAGSDER